MHVRVLGYGGRTTGEYSIAFTVEAEHAQGELEPNDEPSTANEVAPGETLAGMVSPNDDEDWFSVALVAGQRLRLGTSNGAGRCDFDVVLQLFGGAIGPEPGTTSCTDATDDRLACDDDSGPDNCADLTFTAPVEPERLAGSQSVSKSTQVLSAF